MYKLIIALVAGLVPVVPAIIFFIRKHKSTPVHATRGLVIGLNGFNAVIGLMAAGVGVAWLASPASVMASGLGLQATTTDPYASLAASIATGLATVGAGIAVSSTGAAAIGSIAEKPETFGRAIIFVGLAEGIAIYGLIIAFLLLNR